MNKFAQILTKTHKGILESRATNLAAQAQLEQEALVSAKKRRYLQLDQDFNSLTDLSPDSTTSLKPGGTGKDFNAAVWVEKLHNLQVERLEAKIELEVAENTYATWFGEKEVKAPKAAKSE